MPAPSLHRYGQVEKCVVVSHTHLWVLCNQLINFIFHRYKNINMKNIISFSTLILFSVALNAQSLSGTQTLPGTRGGAMAYTMLNWKVNYQFVEKNGMFYLSINNPSVSVANNSLYGSYSKSALGLSVWPDSDPGPYNFSIEVTIVYPGGSQKLRAQMDAFTAGVFIGSSNDSEFKTLSVSSFKVSSAGNMNYNGGRDIVVDRLIEAKKYGGENTSQSSTNTSGQTSTSNTSAQGSTSSGSTSQSGSTNNSSTNSNTPTTTKPIDNYDPNTGLYTNPLTTGNSSTTSDYQKNYETGQQIGTLVVGIADLFTPSPEEIQRREQASAEYARQKKIEEDLAWEKRLIDDRNRFDLIYLPLMDEAIKGNENARMILYFASYHLLSTEKVPKRDSWFREAYENKNPDAYMLVAEEEKDKGNGWISYTQDAANVGSVDAMLRLADWHDRNHGGGDAKLALEWYTIAAEKGSPNAMYYLGMIYKYGITEDLSVGAVKNFRKKMHVKYDVIIDEEKALVWFANSIQPNYPLSLFATGNRTNLEYYTDLSSYFNKESYKQLSLIYKKGKIVPKDEVKAKELMSLYENYGRHYDKHKF
jgi:TPR repeat protein